MTVVTACFWWQETNTVRRRQQGFAFFYLTMLPTAKATCIYSVKDYEILPLGTGGDVLTAENLSACGELVETYWQQKQSGCGAMVETYWQQKTDVRVETFWQQKTKCVWRHCDSRKLNACGDIVTAENLSVSRRALETYWQQRKKCVWSNGGDILRA